MNKFEYRVIFTAGLPVKESDLNALGGEGWELIALIFDAAYFKRVKAEAPQASETKTAPKKVSK